MNSAYFIDYPDIVALPTARHESIRKIMQTTIHDRAKIIRIHTYSDMQLSDVFWVNDSVFPIFFYSTTDFTVSLYVLIAKSL